jgi:Variant SH3 domain
MCFLRPVPLHSAGDVITVVSKSEDGWWTGTLNGASGTFPANHIEGY